MAWLIKIRNSLLCLEIVKRLYLVHKASHFYKVYDRWLVDSLILSNHKNPKAYSSLIFYIAYKIIKPNSIFFFHFYPLWSSFNLYGSTVDNRETISLFTKKLKIDISNEIIWGRISKWSKGQRNDLLRYKAWKGFNSCR